MISEYLQKCISGEGPLQAELVLPPIERVQVRPNVIYDLCRGKKVLHLGCTDHLPTIDYKIKRGTYLHQQLSFTASKCLGIDINEEAANHLKTYGIDNVLIADITKPGNSSILDEQWDYLLMGEMLEHVDNPVDFLRRIGENYGSSIDKVIITVPNAFGWIHMMQALQQGREWVNSDHRYWFTPYTLSKVVHQAGMDIDDLVMCLYENSVGILSQAEEELLKKPVMLDTILIVASWKA